MKRRIINARLIKIAAVLLLATPLAATRAQTSAPQTATAPQTQTSNNPAQAAQVQKLPTALNFTPEQVTQWRQINHEFGGQQVAAVARVRAARQALNEAMESATPNEEVIKQRAKDLADAQSALTQIQALRQARVLQILTPEQRTKLKEIRQQAQELKREQQANGGGQGRPLKRNGNRALLTPAQRKTPAQPQKPKD